MATKNPCGKRRPVEKPYERWQTHDGSWTWDVLKKYQADDDKPHARAFCNVRSPYTPEGELGDTYVKSYKPGNVLVGVDYDGQGLRTAGQ